MKNFTDNLSKFIASFFGLGFMPIMPGTLGSAAGAGIYYLLWRNEVFFYAVLFFLIMLGFAVSGRAEAAFKNKDPRRIVIDEVIGMMIAFILVPLNPANFMVIFLLFRIIDVIKPYPLRRIEKAAGGWGIILDDVAAGFYVNLIFHISASFILYKTL